ncbi:uncharacterized protein LOC123526192 [Mercenaria mercenaria]|uniref:uncharacterized protein LOC123526192 n=1 Tax=Mercenaria mercenaria TaxID=6596 RepID=UPI00234E6951|nr:uncharacterized protein LOC123526192 [Mercenaria mercenaria]
MAESGWTSDSKQSVLATSDEENEFCCDPCEHDGHILPAESYCVNCQEYLCSVCYTIHLQSVVWRHHRLKDKISMPKAKADRKKFGVCTQLCDHHVDKTIEYFCKSHVYFGCSTCMTEEHNTCEKIDYIPEVAVTFEKSRELNDLQKSLTELLKLNESQKLGINRKSKAVAVQAERAKGRIKTLRKEVDEIFDDMEKEIDALKQSDDDKMAELANKVKFLAEEVQRHISHIERNLNQRKLCQLFIETQHVLKYLPDLSVEVVRIRENSDIQRYQFNDSEIRDIIEKLKEIPALDIKDQYAKVPELKNDLNVRADGEENECEITGIAQLSEDLLVVADNKNDSVKLIDILNEDIKSVFKFLANDNSRKPFDVTKIEDNALVAITYPLEKKIVFLAVSLSENMTINRVIGVNGSCFGIECAGNTLIVTFNEPACVKILAMTGTVIRTIERHFTDFPDYVAVHPDQKKIYISSWEEEEEIQCLGKVTCTTAERETKFVYRDRILEGPQGACVGNFGAVYVCGYWSDNVLQLTEDCRFIQEILNKDDGLHEPMCITLSKQSEVCILE